MAKPKKINIQIIERNDDAGPYKIMDHLIRLHHHHPLNAKIALAWRFGWTPDADGNVVLGQCKKAADVDYMLHGYDFVILLNADAYNAAQFTEAQKSALIDHELCHAEVATDEDGVDKVDEAGRTVWRIRKHDIEEFQEVVSRHGCWKHELESFARAALERNKRPLLHPESEAA